MISYPAVIRNNNNNNNHIISCSHNKNGVRNNNTYMCYINIVGPGFQCTVYLFFWVILDNALGDLRRCIICFMKRILLLLQRWNFYFSLFDRFWNVRSLDYCHTTVVWYTHAVKRGPCTAHRPRWTAMTNRRIGQYVYIILRSYTHSFYIYYIIIMCY